jgi:hypothetical protein
MSNEQTEHQVTQKPYDHDLNMQVGKPGERRFADLIENFPIFQKVAAVDFSFLSDKALRQGDVRIVRLPAMADDIIVEVEVRQAHYDRVEQGDFDTVHVMSRKGQNTADVIVGFSPDLARYYTMARIDVHRYPISETRMVSDGKGGEVEESFINVPRKHVKFYRIDDKRKQVMAAITRKPYGSEYTPWGKLWVKIGTRQANGLAPSGGD